MRQQASIHLLKTHFVKAPVYDGISVGIDTYCFCLKIPIKAIFFLVFLVYLISDAIYTFKKYFSSWIPEMTACWMSNLIALLPCFIQHLRTLWILVQLSPCFRGLSFRFIC